MANEQRIQVRRDTLANFVAAGVVPKNGEPVAVVDAVTKRASAYVIGDGVSTVDQLPALSKGDRGRQGEPGIPGTNAVPADEAVSGYLASEASSSGTTLRALMRLASEPTGVASDDTQSLITLLNTAAEDRGNVQLRPGHYVLSGVTIPDGVTLVGYGSTIKADPGSQTHTLQLGNGAALVGVAVDASGVTAAGKNAVEVSGVTDALVRDVRVLGSGNVGIEIANSQRYSVTGCTVTGAFKQGISVVFADDGRLVGNTVSNCEHGIQWWGGDATSSNVIGIRRIVIANNIVENVTGGIWGSLGADITVTGNAVRNVSDVGIDFEGCVDSAATGNTVQDATHACLAVFYGSSNIVFSGNAISNAVAGGAGFKAFTTEVSSAILVVGNTIRAQNPVTCDDGALGDSEFLSNDITSNVAGKSAISLFSADSVTIGNNRVRVANSSAVNVVGGKNAVVVNNRISTSSDTSSMGDAAGGVRLIWQSSTASAQGALVVGNRIEGFVKGILDDCSGDNTSHAWIKNNQVNTVRYRGSYGAGYYGIIEENRSVSDPNTVTSVAAM